MDLKLAVAPARGGCGGTTRAVVGAKTRLAISMAMLPRLLGNGRSPELMRMWQGRESSAFHDGLMVRLCLIREG